MAVAARLVLYVAGGLLVRVADEGARVGLILLSMERTGSPALGGLLVSALLVPHVVAAPAMGLLADRSRRPQLIVAAPQPVSDWRSPPRRWRWARCPRRW